MSRPHTPYGSFPQPNSSQMNHGSGSSGVADFAQGNPSQRSPLSQSLGQQQPQRGQFHEDFDASQRGSSILGDDQGLHRSASTASTAVPASAPSRSNTLKKKNSVVRKASVKRSGSRKSLKAGSIKNVGGLRDEHEYNSVFYTPVPTSGTPTEILANRFQAWRQLLKSLVAYFREIQNSYDTRAKAINKVQNTIASITSPSVFSSHQGLSDATRILNDYHKHSITEAHKSKDIENDVIGALTGLRSDLGQKIKEIKSLSGDFKNTVEKEKGITRREVEKLQDALQHADHEDGSATGKNDPFVVRLGVERAIEKQIDEENYLHRAYLNLESSGRELESIVVGEIQKAYNALAGILKREGDDAYSVVESLRAGPISMPKDKEWMQFVENDTQIVAPGVPVRRIEDIEYPGKNHPAAAEVRAGMLERKSKYLKSYTPGWYVLSPTHLHEFKSADKIYTQPPVMSLYLPDQRLGSKSDMNSSSHKFMLKGKQAGGAHRGHSWVFRAESNDTMLAWFEDIKILTEKTGPEREAFVRRHARSVSGNSERRRSMSSDGMEEDEADAVPYSADAASLSEHHPVEQKPDRPQPGGRFPSDLQVPRTAPLSPSSGSSEPENDAGFIAAAGAIPGSSQHEYHREGEDPYRMRGVSSGTAPPIAHPYDEDVERYMAQPPQQPQTPPPHQDPVAPLLPQQPQQHSFLGAEAADQARPNSMYGDWMAPAAAGVGVGVLSTEALDHHQRDQQVPQTEEVTPTVTENSERRRSSPHEAGIPGPYVPSSSSNKNNNISAYDGDREVPVPSTNVSGTGGSSTVVQPSSVASDGSALGRLESEGAHETGRIFPVLVRHDTDMSISALHVPGEYP